jgi:hypothetical protein
VDWKKILTYSLLGCALYMSGVLTFFYPIVFFHLFLKQNTKTIYAVLVITGIVMFVGYVSTFFAPAPYGMYLPMIPLAESFSWSRTLGVVFGLLFGMSGVVIGCGVGYSVMKRRSMVNLILFYVAMPWLVFIGVFAAAEAMSATQLAHGISAHFKEILLQFIVAQESQGLSVADRAVYINMVNHIDTFAALLPSILWLFMLFTAFMTLMVGRFFIMKRRVLNYYNSLAATMMPFWLVWSAIGIGSVYTANLYFVNNAMIGAVTLNLLIIVASFYLIQGLMIVSYYLRRWRSLFVRFAVIAGILLYGETVIFMLVVLGFTDFWFDYRKLQRKPV